MGWRPDHKRMKPKAGAKPDAAERAHMDRLAQMACLVCGVRLVTLHHVSAYADRMGRIARSHKLIVPLCDRHHLIQHGPRESVEALGHRGFFEVYKIDLLNAALDLMAESTLLGIFSHEENDRIRKIYKSR